jgi:hypothetical protein
MVANYFSKPLQGKLFQKFHKSIMGHWILSQNLWRQECVGSTWKLITQKHILTDQWRKDCIEIQNKILTGYQDLTLYDNYYY